MAISQGRGLSASSIARITRSANQQAAFSAEAVNLGLQMELANAAEKRRQNRARNVATGITAGASALGLLAGGMATKGKSDATRRRWRTVGASVGALLGQVGGIGFTGEAPAPGAASAIIAAAPEIGKEQEHAARLGEIEKRRQAIAARREALRAARVAEAQRAALIGRINSKLARSLKERPFSGPPGATQPSVLFADDFWMSSFGPNLPRKK
jgi:hypothetical protein